MMPTHEQAPLLHVEGLAVTIGATRVLDDVSFSVDKGEIIGLVGESGSGKTLTGLSLMGLLPRSALTQGEIRFQGSDLLAMSDEQMRRVRGQQLSMIFQEPRASLHPARPLGKQLTDVVLAHESTSRRAALRRSADLLGQVGLSNPRRVLDSYTFELSGGMCQRVMIAMALICEPELLIADEPTTALDVTIQAQIISLLQRLADERGIAVVLISHNLGVISEVCSRVITMYCGQIANIDTAEALLTQPRHPYPSALLQASQISLDADEAWVSIPGTPANPANPPPGCRFNPRCEYATDECRSEIPALVRSRSGGWTRCVRHEELELVGVTQ